ncbi:hypothetical protein BDN72DRAFT_906929 [Pluteus cervinus]|uniref:Uncharacterized protein n=1 Tax=Pluteus cervinus TaxID=181527 RepID=A0ACD2ZY30_9AGAR|nr:hypothetical protein BDN72DRAFT_906929 [Pluteus cervinus]
MLRCDLLALILVTKLAPTYYTKLGRLLAQTRRYRELSWRKEFKKEWRKLQKREITMPINDAYKLNAEKWNCTCPAFVVSRFLLCKHLVQLIHSPPPISFLEVKRHRTIPFWRHKTLQVKGRSEEGCHASDEASDEHEMVDPFDDDAEPDEAGKTFEDVLQADRSDYRICRWPAVPESISRPADVENPSV